MIGDYDRDLCNLVCPGNSHLHRNFKLTSDVCSNWHSGLTASLRRRRWQIRPTPALRMATRCHGRTDTSFSDGHAATMVTSGVYLLVRMNNVLTDDALLVIAVIGATTALFAALCAVAQHDIKRVLAYSTVSQLGYMFLAIGSGAYVAAIFHVITHAFFKALLFLGSGSVIHGMHDEQDMRKMGAQRIAMPITAATFIVGWLAIAGVPPFAGFWSKDEILLAAWEQKNIGPLLLGRWTRNGLTNGVLHEQTSNSGVLR